MSSELNQTDTWIEIPEEVREMYKYYRSTPLVRAYGSGKALGTPAHIYFRTKVSALLPHKLNSALAQAYYCKRRCQQYYNRKPVPDNGSSPFVCCKVFSLEAAVYQVKISYEQSHTDAASCRLSDTGYLHLLSTRAGKIYWPSIPNHRGSLRCSHFRSHQTFCTTRTVKVYIGICTEP